MDLMLISPPVANFGQATPALSVLTAYLRAQGWVVGQWDLAIDAFHHFHSPEYLELCRQKLEDHRDKLTDSTLGTVQYISPEQARGQEDLDVRSDIYSLGATLYQLVVGELPFTGSDDQEIMAKQ